jgi:hypothetical protein
VLKVELSEEKVIFVVVSGTLLMQTNIFMIFIF